MYGTPTATATATGPAGLGRRPWLAQDDYDRLHFDRRVRWCVEEGEHRQAELKRHRARHLGGRWKRAR